MIKNVGVEDDAVQFEGATWLRIFDNMKRTQASLSLYPSSKL